MAALPPLEMIDFEAEGVTAWKFILCAEAIALKLSTFSAKYSDNLFCTNGVLPALASGYNSSVDDFIAFLLRLLDFDSNDHFVCLRKELSFYMSGQRVEAKPDVCLMNDYGCFLLVQEDKRTRSSDDPEPQLIAESIAAFYQNHLQRKRAGLQPLESQVITGITMVGIAPIFYRTVVPEPLLDALVTASYPKEQTVVLRFVPPVPSPMRYLSEGMQPLENRGVVFQCLEALKKVVT